MEFISGKMSCMYIFLDLDTPCTDRHRKTDKNNTPCKDAFLAFPADFQGHKLCPLILGPKQMPLTNSKAD